MKKKIINHLLILVLAVFVNFVVAFITRILYSIISTVSDFGNGFGFPFRFIELHCDPMGCLPYVRTEYFIVDLVFWYVILVFMQIWLRKKSVVKKSKPEDKVLIRKKLTKLFSVWFIFYSIMILVVVSIGILSLSEIAELYLIGALQLISTLLLGFVYRLVSGCSKEKVYLLTFYFANILNILLILFIIVEASKIQ